MHRRVIGRESAQVAKGLAARAVEGKVYVKAQSPIPDFAMWDYTDRRAVAREVCMEMLFVPLCPRQVWWVGPEPNVLPHAIYERGTGAFKAMPDVECPICPDQSSAIAASRR